MQPEANNDTFHRKHQRTLAIVVQAARLPSIRPVLSPEAGKRTKLNRRQDGSYVELERCATRERALEIRRLAITTGEFTHVLIFWVTGIHSGSHCQ